MILAYPMLVHSMLLSTHFNSWRGYLEFQEKELIEAVCALRYHIKLSNKSTGHESHMHGS